MTRERLGESIIAYSNKFLLGLQMGGSELFESDVDSGSCTESDLLIVCMGLKI